MIVKVCGLRDADNIRAVRTAGADMTGLIFHKGSPRHVSMINSHTGTMPDMPHACIDCCSTTQVGNHAHVPTVGVFVDEQPQYIITHVYNYALDYVQLHGDETTVMIDNLRSTIVPDIRAELKIIKTIGISCRDDFARCADYEGHVDMFLFDTACESHGGCGRHFDWSTLDAYTGSTPFLLSGGIGPDDVGRIRSIAHPMMVGVDINSRFETAPAMKDVDAVAQFIAQVKN